MRIAASLLRRFLPCLPPQNKGLLVYAVIRFRPQVGISVQSCVHAEPPLRSSGSRQGGESLESEEEERAQFHIGKYTEIFFLLHSAILYWIKGFLAISHFFHMKEKKIPAFLWV